MAKICKAITPRRLQPDVFRLEILNELRRVEKLILKDFQATTKTWDHKPEFASKISLPQGTPGVEVSTDDKIYGYVTKGTPPHIILPKNPRGVLVFQAGYKAKTTPRVIGSGAGGAFGETVVAHAVQHPGTEAREFDETIRDKWLPLFAEHIDAALARGAKKCGHGVT